MGTIPASPVARTDEERAAGGKLHAMSTSLDGYLLWTFSDALAAVGVPGGAGLRMNGPDGVGVIAHGETPAGRWRARYVLAHMGVTAIGEDAHGFVSGVLARGAEGHGAA